MGIFKQIWEEITVIGKWFAKEAVSVETVALPIAIAITEGVKKEEDNGTMDVIAEIVDSVTGTHVAAEANTFIKAEIPKVLAAELSLELPANPTADEWKVFGTNVATAIGGKNAGDRSKFLTNFAVDVYKIVQVATGQPYSSIYAEIVDIVEKAYKAYLSDKEAASQPPVIVPPIGRAAEEAQVENGVSVDEVTK